MRRLSPLLVLLLVGCSSVSDGFDDGMGGGQDGAVSRAELGEQWPLTTEEGVLRCDGQDGVGAATIETGGTVYALNGNAKNQDAGADLEPVWADDPALPGAKKDIGVLIQRALELCE